MSPRTIPARSDSTIWCDIYNADLENQDYATNELRSPTKKTRKIQRVTPEKTNPLDVVQPSGEAKTTGTPTTRIKERAMSKKIASWKNRSILKILNF